ncbi:chemerin-like receptor 1 [Clarias gariepinus]
MDSVTGSAKNEVNASLEQSVAPTLCTDVMCVLLAIAIMIIMVIGVTGNGLVIWIAGFKIKKTVNTVWYLSLAVSDFLYCTFLPLHIVYIVKREWVLGLFMCKFISFNLFLNWFSSILLLVIISVDRCVVVMFPVWTQNKRTLRRALVIILLSWIISALLSVPAAIFRDIKINNKFLKVCYYNYKKDEHTTVVVCRFIFLYMIPLLIITVCSVLITKKLKSNQMQKSNKPFKIMTALIVAFFLSWMPYHIFNLMELNPNYASVLPTGKKIAFIVASTNSFINPLLYAFMGKDFKGKCYELLSKIESTFEEEVQSTRFRMSITNSGESSKL